MVTGLYRELDVTDVDTLLVVAQLHELVVAPARALRCYTAAMALQPSRLDVWLRLVGTVLLNTNHRRIAVCSHSKQ